MDEMRIKLSSKLMRGMISKIIAKVIFNSIGYKPEIQINEIEAEMKNGKISFHINADGAIDDKVLIKVNTMIDDTE